MNATSNSTILTNSTLSNLTSLSTLEIFDAALKRYPIEVASTVSVLTALFAILCILLFIIAIGHRAYLVLFCYKFIPKQTNRSKLRKQFWLHILYCFLVVYSFYKVVTFAITIYSVAAARLTVSDLSLVGVDVFMCDIAVMITIQIFLVVLSSVAFTKIKKALIIIARILLLLCFINGIAYVAVLAVGFHIALGVEFEIYATLIDYISIPLVAINKVILTTMMIVVGVCIQKLVGAKNSQAKTLTKRLLVMALLMITATVVTFVCTALSLVIDPSGVIFMTLVTMAAPSFIIFVVVIIMFWPSRYSFKVFKKNTLSGSEMNFDSSTGTDTGVSTPTNFLSDDNNCNTDFDASTPKIDSLTNTEIKIALEQEDTPKVADMSLQPTNDDCPQEIVDVTPNETV
ncbi:7 TM domain-containing transmembrane protein [Acrasis kona]|uniref:7 TM domain-containing transmembrane protein n=1 Tax=Acrasis kona TaxID=1008807 RepID=A0AAW2Z7V7_9EUKA